MNKPFLIMLDDADLERIENYTKASYGSGGFQGFLRKLMRQQVDVSLVPAQLRIERVIEDPQPLLFNDDHVTPEQAPEGS